MTDSLYKKPLTGLLLLAGAAGGPYMLFETETGRQASQGASQIFGISSSAGRDGLGTPDGGSAPWNAAIGETLSSPLNPELDEHSLQQPAIHSLQEVLRFDITPGWVLQRFPRVSTVLADSQFDGLRVPLITGTTPADIAGTLTYSFDRYQRLQRVKLEGAVGDPSRFVAELQKLYHLQQEPSLGGMLYTLRWNGRPASIVYIEPAAVIYADAPYARFNILIELNQAGLEYGLSSQAQQLIDAGKSTRRW